MSDRNSFTRLLSIKDDIQKIVHQNSGKISPQLEKRLQFLIDTVNSSFYNEDIKSIKKTLNRINSVIKRLLLEILQAHYNTKQREQDAIRLIESKNCILEPNLIDAAINLLLKLFKADGVRFTSDTSYERKVLIRFLIKELNGKKYSKSQIEKIIQTLYRCSCFQIIIREGASSELRLKEDLQNASDIRLKLDSELMKLVLSSNIRLSPESWSYLLYRSSNPETLSRMQSLLDKLQNSVSITELKEEIIKSGDKYNILDKMDELQNIHDLVVNNLKICENSYNDNMRITVENLLDNLLNLSFLFTIRQSRTVL